MSFKNYVYSIEEIKAQDIVDYLSKLGFEPAKIRNADYWYHSPLRAERTPSFKVNRNLNRWYDHGIGKGGNIIDFGILYHNCNVGEFLQLISGNFSFQKPLNNIQGPSRKENSENQIILVSEGELSSISLVNYLSQRRISLELARQFCREINYKVNEKTYYGIGLKNDSGGYEIRTPYFKNSISPKDITTITNGSQNVHAFEGFIDFLSFVQISQNQSLNQNDFVILNSVSLFERSRLFLEQHESINLYFDRDKTGQNCSQYALSLSDKYKDQSYLYSDYKDVNEWLMNTENSKKQNKNLKL